MATDCRGGVRTTCCPTPSSICRPRGRMVPTSSSCLQRGNVSRAAAGERPNRSADEGRVRRGLIETEGCMETPAWYLALQTVADLAIVRYKAAEAALPVLG